MNLLCLRSRAVFVVFVLGMMSVATGEEPVGRESASSTSNSLPILNSLIESWPVDVAMNREQELEIWRTLFQPYTPALGEMPMSEWLQEIAPLCQIEVDVRSLEVDGLTTDTPLVFGIGGPPRPLAVHARQALTPLDLGIEIRSGVIRIVTRETAGENLAVRIYNVSPLLPGFSATQQRSRLRGLIETIQNTIDPDNWEVLGGMATIQVHPSEKSLLLCIAARTETHWHVQMLLDQLHRVGGAKPADAIAPARAAPGFSDLPRFRLQ